MFYYLRKHVRHFMLVFLVLFIGGLFLWNYQAKNMPDAVLVVNGAKIPYQVFQRLFSKEIERIKEQKPEDMTPQETDSVKRDILSSLVQEEILRQQAEKWGLSVPDEIVVAVLTGLPQFQKEGKFSPELYRDFLTYYYRASPKDFEEEIRKSLLTRMVRRTVLSGLKTTEWELKLEYDRRNPEGDYSKERDEFRNSFLNEKRSLVYSQWLNEQFQKSKIDNYLPRFEGP